MQHGLEFSRPPKVSQFIEQFFNFELSLTLPIAALNLQDQDLTCLRAVKDYIDKHITDAFTLEHLAHKAGINEHKLKNGFKELFGQPVFVYIRDQRLILAKKLLQETKLDETVIAKKVGYKTLSGFIKAFTKKHKRPPHNLRGE
jgi:AraC-like DNA-binding protein